MSIVQIHARVWWLIVLGLILSIRPVAAESLIVGGMGSALGTLRALGEAYEQRRGVAVTVLPSIGTGGGIRATADGKIDLGVVGRLPTDKEAAGAVTVRLTTRTPYVLATSIANPPSLRREDFAQLIASPHAKWPDGTPVRTILRPASESDYAIIFAMLPGAEAAITTLRRRGDLPVASTDQENLDLAERIVGSLVGTTYAQVVSEQRGLRMITIDGVAPSLDAMAEGFYPVTKHFHFITKAPEPPKVLAFLEFIRSQEGTNILYRMGSLR